MCLFSCNYRHNLSSSPTAAATSDKAEANAVLGKRSSRIAQPRSAFVLPYTREDPADLTLLCYLRTCKTTTTTDVRSRPIPSLHPTCGGACCHARHAHKIDADPSNPLLTDPQSSSFALADCARPVLLCAPPETFQPDCPACLSRPQRLARLLLLMLPAWPPTAHP